jgi:hypothetical protein
MNTQQKNEVIKMINRPDWMQVDNVHFFMTQIPPNTFALIRHDKVHNYDANGYNGNRYEEDNVKFFPVEMRKLAEEVIGLGNKKQDENIITKSKRTLPDYDAFYFQYQDRKFSFEIQDEFVIPTKPLTKKEKARYVLLKEKYREILQIMNDKEGWLNGNEVKIVPKNTFVLVLHTSFIDGGVGPEREMDCNMYNGKEKIKLLPISKKKEVQKLLRLDLHALYGIGAMKEVHTFVEESDHLLHRIKRRGFVVRDYL